MLCTLDRRYWFNNGVRWPGVIALVLGMAASAPLSNTPYLKGALSTHLVSGGDLSAVGGFAVGATAYWLLLCILPTRSDRRADDRRGAADPAVVALDPEAA